ncbi:MAG: hypothetical protein HYS87_02970 [Candidatus Colwellbacteria bacterium]|nr:hypothetical protein [Candidatus Colwellbacteria bacterium]
MRFWSYTIAIIALTGIFIWGTPTGLKLKAASLIFPNSENNLQSEIEQLKIQIESLKTEIFNDEITQPDSFKVYGSHPLRGLQEIAIEAGSSNLEVAAAIVSNRNLFVGVVKKVFSTYSVVSTIFDPSIELAVRIGTEQRDGFLKGGSSPRITMIPKESEVRVGDIVLTASAGLPYGLNIGRIIEIQEDINMPFKEALIAPSVEINKLRDVQVSR